MPVIVGKSQILMQPTRVLLIFLANLVPYVWYKNCEEVKGEHGFSGDKNKYNFKIWGGICWKNRENFEGTKAQWKSFGLKKLIICIGREAL